MPTTTTVKPGHAASRRKARQSAEKVAANAAAVQAINEASAASTDRVERLNLAREERKALVEWTAGGQKGPRPATPNMDAVARREPTASTKTAGGPRTKRGDRGQQATAVAKLGRRGPGRKLTDEELLAYVAGVKQAHPDSSASDELEFAYWIEKLAVTRQRFMAAWTGSLSTTKATPATPGKAEPVPAKRRGAKAAPAKKAATPRKRATKAAKVA